MSEDLKVLFPGVDLMFNIDGKDEKVTVKPFKVGQLMKVMKPVAELIGLAQTSNSDNDFIIKLISEGGDRLSEVVQISTGKDSAWFESLELDQAVELVTAIIAQNKDSFEKKVGPALSKTKTLFQPVTATSEASTPA